MRPLDYNSNRRVCPAQNQSYMIPQNSGPTIEDHAGPSSSSRETVPVNNASEEAVIDDQTKAELLMLVQRYLANNCPEASETLKNELEKKNIIPDRYDINGKARRRTFDEYLNLIPKIQPNLMDLMAHLNLLTNKSVPPAIAKLPLRIFNSKRQSLTRNSDVQKKVPVVEDILTPRPSLSAMQNLNGLKMLSAREMGTPLSSRLLLRKDSINNMELHSRILGHLASVFCVAFDRTGRYIITGADDNLVKVWDAHNGILRCTLRGHSGEIGDMSISHENTVLATASNDKTVRIWCLQTGRVLQVYSIHTGIVTTVAFLPFMVGDTRYLVSTASDCRVIFYKWNGPKKEFPEVIGPEFIHDERVTSGSRIVSSCHSPGGNLVCVGDSKIIRIYRIHEESVEKIFEHHAHMDRVDTMVWSHNYLRFVSGSKDGTAKVWKFSAGHWTSVNLYNVIKPLEQTHERHPRLAPNGRGGLHMTLTNPVPVLPANKKNSYKVTMLCWSLDDDYVISTGTDYIVRIWEWKTGKMVHEMLGHENDVFVLTAHPIYKEYVFSAGHDGFVFVWDIYKGVAVKKLINNDTMLGNCPIFDFNISPDGTLFALVDNQGHLSILGVGKNDKIRSYPKQQFFSTDYRPFLFDHTHHVVDAETMLAPHLMDPPVFVNADVIPHEQQWQRMVAGNDLIAQNRPVNLDESQETSNNPVVQELIDQQHTNSKCPWIDRDIVARLRESELKKVYEEMNYITKEENDEFEREKKRFDPEIERIVLQSSQIPQSGQIERRGRRGGGVSTSRPSNRISARDVEAVFMQFDRPLGRGRNRLMIDPLGYQSDPDDENYTNDSHSDGDSSDETDDEVDDQQDDHVDEDDSDYEVGRPESATVFRSRSNYTVTGRRKTRRNRNLDDSGPSSQQSNSHSHHASPRRRRGRPITSRRNRRSQDEQTTSPERSRNKRRRDRSEKSPDKKRAKVVVVVEKNEFEDTDLFTQSDPDAPSTSRAHRAARRASNSGDDKKEVKEKVAKKNVKKEPSVGPIIGYPVWMKQFQVRRFPYIAQLGDHVVYCLQGHQSYLNAVDEIKLYRIPRAYDIRDDLDAEVYCIVDELEYVLKPYRTIVLKLAVTDEQGRRKKVEPFNVMYHDMEGQPDFLILRQHYDLALSYKFDSGSAVEAMIDDKWWVGRVQKRVPYDDGYPMSNWMSIVVSWDTGEEPDLYCPWDIQPKKSNRKTNTQATNKEMEQWGSYKPQEGDWPKFEDDQTYEQARDHYLKRAQKAISQLHSLGEVDNFKEPVNLSDFPDYSEMISYPSDLQTIEERINNKYYRRLIALLQDIQYIAINTEVYNFATAPIVHNAIALAETLFRFITELEHDNAASLYETLWQKSGFELTTYAQQLKPYRKNVRLSESYNQPSTSKISPSSKQSRRTEEVWIRECREIMEKVMTQDFKDKMTRLEKMKFFEEEDTFEQLVEKLANKQYESPVEFEKAVVALTESIKNTVDDVRSPINKSLLTFQSQFKLYMKQITTKYAKMIEAPTGRGQRAAAQHAPDLWRNIDAQLFPGPSTSSSTSTRLRERSKRQTKYNIRKRDDFSYREDDEEF